MRTVPGMLRGQMVRKAPTLCMTATATEAEVKELKEVSYGLQGTQHSLAEC